MRADWTDDPEGWFWAAAAAMSEPGGAADARGPELSASGFGGLRGLLDDEPEDRDPLGLPYCDDPAQAAADDAARRRADDAARAAAAAAGSADTLEARRLAALEAARRAGVWSGDGERFGAAASAPVRYGSWGTAPAAPAAAYYLPPVPVAFYYQPVTLVSRTGNPFSLGPQLTTSSFHGWQLAAASGNFGGGWTAPLVPPLPVGWSPVGNFYSVPGSAARAWYSGAGPVTVAPGFGVAYEYTVNAGGSPQVLATNGAPIPPPPTAGPQVRYVGTSAPPSSGIMPYFEVLTPGGWVRFDPATPAGLQVLNQIMAGTYNIPGAVVPASPWPEPGTVAPSPVIVDPIAANDDGAPGPGPSAPTPSGGSIPVAAFVVQATGAARASYPRANSISNRGIPLAGFGQRPARGLGCGACGGNCSRRRGVPGSR